MSSSDVPNSRFQEGEKNYNHAYKPTCSLLSIKFAPYLNTRASSFFMDA
jgi:hypothetical protein